MTERPVRIRPATQGDENSLFDLLCMAYGENASFAMSEKKVKAMIEAGTREKGVIIGVADAPDGSGLAGSIGAVFTQWWYTDDWHIDECWNYVHPDHRKGINKQPAGYGSDLIKYMKWVAEQMNMALHLGILTNKRTKAKIRMYESHMPQVGAFFIHNLQSCNGPLATEMLLGDD
jgi:hypothetical protein